MVGGVIAGCVCDCACVSPSQVFTTVAPSPMIEMTVHAETGVRSRLLSFCFPVSDSVFAHLLCCCCVCACVSPVCAVCYPPQLIRPFVVCAILRGMTFTPENYQRCVV